MSSNLTGRHLFLNAAHNAHTTHTMEQRENERSNGRYEVAEILPLGTALANVVAARGEPDEFDQLLMESEEETPLSIERITLDENGFNRRDADGKKESVGKTIDGVIVMVTKPRSIFVNEDDDFPLCQSLDRHHRHCIGGSTGRRNPDGKRVRETSAASGPIQSRTARFLLC